MDRLQAAWHWLRVRVLVPRWLLVLLALFVLGVAAVHGQSVTLTAQPDTALRLFVTYRTASGAAQSNRDVLVTTSSSACRIAPVPGTSRSRYVYVLGQSAGSCWVRGEATVSGVTYRDSVFVAVGSQTRYVARLADPPVVPPPPPPPPPPADTEAPARPGTPAITLLETAAGEVRYRATWAQSLDPPSNAPAGRYHWTAAHNTGRGLTTDTVLTTEARFALPYAPDGAAASGYFCVGALDDAGNRSPNACNAVSIPAEPLRILTTRHVRDSSITQAIPGQPIQLCTLFQMADGSRLFPTVHQQRAACQPVLRLAVGGSPPQQERVDSCFRACPMRLLDPVPGVSVDSAGLVTAAPGTPDTVIRVSDKPCRCGR